MAIDWDQLGTRVDEPALEATDWDAFGTRVEDTPEPEPSLPPMAADMPQVLSSADLKAGKRYSEPAERKVSVLQDEPAIAPVNNVSRAPVTPETRAAINAAFDTDADGGRARLTGDAGFIGQIARQRQAEFDRLDDSAAGQTDTAATLDPRVEKRKQQLIKKGEDPRFAERAASEAARAGGAPGMEVQDLIRGSGTAQEVAALPSTTTEVATNAVMRGVHQFRSMGYGLAAAATQAVGAEDVSLDLLKKYMASEDAARKYPAAVQDFTHIKSWSDVPTYVLEAVLGNATQLVASIGSGGVGAIVGKKVGEKAVAGMLEEQAKKLLARRVAQGTAVGAGASSIGMETGSIYGQVAEQTSERRPEVALAFGTIAGALGAIPAMRAVGKIMGHEAVSLAMKDVLKRYPVEALKQLASEGPTEFLQQWAENAATSYVDGRDLFTKDNLIAAIDAALKGAAAGAATGVAAQGMHDARNAGSIARENSPARALADALSSGQLAAPDAAAMAAIVNQDAGGMLTPEQAQARMTSMAQAQARLDAARSGQQADATLMQTAQIRDAAQAQARQAKSESVTAIGQASTVDEAIVATQRAVGMDEQELADWALQQAGIDPAALTTIEAQAQAQRQAAQETLTQEVVTDGTQTQETEQAGAGQQAAQADAVAAKAAPVVLQNRDRSTSASITQMNAIAANPDYLRTGPSRTMDQGAPVVFGDLPEGAVLGRTETVADGTGRRVQVRYAVVEAPSVLTSNSADGLANAGYAEGRPGMVRAVAGNARGAGLIESWNRGTAQTYRQELLDDAQSLGIDAQAIAALQRPMLVRIMDEADVTPDMGDRTNIQAGAAMSAVEQAANDVRRVDVRELQFDDAGNPTRETLVAFINQMPVSERGAMLNSDGTPTKQAIDRLVAAAFKQAYDNDALVELAAQATDPEARTVINALASVAGDMAQLAGTGEFDIRQAVSEAAQKAVNARRRGLPLQKVLQERDLQDTPEMLVVAQFMADNIRSAKRIADGLRAWARLAQEQMETAQNNAQSVGFFGEAPTLSRAQIFERLGRDGQTESAQRGGPEPFAQDTGRQDAPERKREAGGAQDGRAGSQERASQAAAEVGEWRSFGRESLGIARADMPQVKAGDRSAFLQFLQARGIDYKQGEADPDSLKPTQAEFSTKKVERFVRGGGVQGERSVLVSSDGYVLDGHHQWLGHRVMGQAIPVIRLDAPIREVLQAANEFPSVRRSEGATNDDTQRDAAVQDFKDAMADLADLATQWQRAAIVPEQHPELMQTLVRLFDAAIRIVGTDLKAATKWVREQLRADPKTRGLLLKVKQSTYQQAAEQALKDMQGAPRDLLGAPDAASYDMARDNFKPPKISAFIPDSLMAQVRNKIAQLHTAATPVAISAADKARAHAMLTPLLERAQESKLGYDQRVIDIARETGALGQMLATIKSMDSATRKLVTDPGVNWDLGKMYDTLRSTIVVSSYADAQKVLDAIRSRFDVIPGRVKNVTDAEIDGERGQFLPSGYGQVLVNVRLPGGVIAEIQINTPEMLAVKLNEGHALYEIERAEPDGSQAQRDAVALQNEIYPMAATAARERAFMASERSRSSLDLAEPGDIGKSRAAVSRSEPVSSSNANTRPSGNLTHSVMSPFTANSQPAGNLSGTFIDTSDKSIVSDEGESGKDGVLESYTPAELKARQDARDAAERQRASDEAQAERRERADAQRDDFALTGSDRAADDVNQSDLFGNSAGPKEEVDGGRQRFTVSIPLYGDVSFRASAPVQADGRVLSSRVITAKTKITADEAEMLGLPRAKRVVYAWRVSVVRGESGGSYSVIEVMNEDHGRTADGEVIGYFKEPNEDRVVQRIAPAIARAAREDWQAAQDRHGGGLFDGAPMARENGAVYETDLFGDPVPAPARRAVRAPSARTGLRGDVQPAAEIRDTQTPQGQYFVRTIVGHETQRRLGADLIRTPQDAAQATAYLYKSAVERFDAIVTDKDGKPLAVVGGFKGAISQTAVYPGTVVAEAVRVPGAARVWFSHNHPSGNSMLSRADENLMRVLSDAFRGSSIEPKGLMAVSNGKFSFLNAEGVAIDAAAIPSAESAANTTVPVIERELAENGATMLIGDPGAALRVAKDFHKQGGDGILLLNAQNAVAAWVPITDQMRGTLRHTGALNAIYRAISESNASAAILVHDGDLDAYHPDSRAVTVGNNIAAALVRVDVRPLDIVNVKNGTSAAQSGMPVAVGPMYSRSASTKATYEARIDALFAGERPRAQGARILDRSDVLALLGLGDGPVHVVESKVEQGRFNHGLSAQDWKKVPEWLENPAAVFDSDTSTGRLVFIAPELVRGSPVRMIIDPRPEGNGVNLLINAYDAERNPFQRWEHEGLLRYFDKQKAPSITGSFQPRLAGLPGDTGRGKILTEKHLAGWRRANDTQQFVAASAKSGATVATIATAISQAYGKSTLNKLQAKGLVTLVQSEDEAVEAAAKARAAKTGQPVGRARATLRASVKNSVADQTQTEAFKRGKNTAVKNKNAPTSDTPDAFAGRPNNGMQERAVRAVSGSPELAQLTEAGSDAHLSTLRAVDVFGDGRRIEYYDDARGVMYSMQKYPRGERWTAWDVLPASEGGNQVIGEFEKHHSFADAVKSIRGARISASARARLSKYGAIPNTWDGYAKKLAKALIDAGVSIHHFANSTQSRSRYIYLDDGRKIRLADHDLPSAYDAPDYDFRYGWDIKRLVEQITTSNNGNFDPADPDIRRSASGSIQGFYDPQSGQSFLIADGLTAEAAPGVLVHEVGIHMAADTTSVRGKQAMDALVRRAETLRRMGRGNPFFDRVTQRMRDAGETSREETAAYIAEAYEQDRTNAPASVKRWVQDFMAAVRAWLFSKGVLIKASQLTLADIAAVARANVRRAADAMTTADQRTLERADDMRFSRQSATAAQGDMFPLQPFILPDESLGGVRRKLQDSFIRALEVQNAVAEQGGVVNEATDFYLAEELSSGKRKALADDLKDKEIKPLVERMAKLGVDMDELALYAYAMHAHERNARIASINPNFADGGSGMTNAEADAVLAQVKAEGREQAFADLHTDLMRIVDGTRRLMRDSGLITAQQYQAMQAQYQNYIPLRGFEAVQDDGRKTGMPAGRGINIRGSETVRALGRASRAGNLIETAIVDRLRAIDRSERNQVGKVFLNFVRHNPDPTLWEIDATRTRQALDRQTGQVNRTTTIDKGEDTISVKVGGREVYIRINDPLLLRALRNTAKEERGEFEMAMMRSVGLYSTLLRNTLTRYNPEFALTNVARDFGFGTAAIVDELGEAAGAKFMGYYAGAIGAAHRYEKGTGGQAGKRKKSEWDRYFNEFRMAGGMTAGFYVKGIDEVQKDVLAMLLDAGAKSARKKLLTRNPAANLVRRAGRVLEWSGSVSENAARVAAYRVAREAGKTPSQAASIAKNLTTNFDRKGEYGQALNALYVFYNAAVQGSHRMLKMLANQRMLGWMAGMGAAGVATAMLSASMGGDDPDDGMAYWDKIPDYVKERNLIIMLPPGVQMEGAEKAGTQGRYIKIPLQYGLNLPIAYGYVIGDVIRNQRDPNRGMNFKKAAVTLTSYFFGAFNPFDGSVDLSNKDSVVLAALPSTFDFLYQQAAGVNGFGRPVAPYKSDFDHKPDSENYNLRQADSVALKVARWLNRSTGGNEAKPGGIDVSAGTIENLIRNLTGGTGTFIYDSVNLAWSAVDSATGGDPDVFVRDVPLARRVYGTLGGDVDQGLFYENRKQADEAFTATKGQIALGIQPEPEERAKALLHKAGTNVTRTLAKIRREMIRVTEDESLSKEQRTARLRELRAKRDQLTSMYNQRFREAMGKFFAEHSSKKESE